MDDSQNIVSPYDRMLVSSKGIVTVLKQSYLRSTCSIDMTYFPFDTQQCHLRFSSFMHSSNKIVLNPAYGAGERMLSLM